MFGRSAVGYDLDRARLSQPIEPDKEANALAARKLSLGGSPTEEQPIKLALAKDNVQFVCSYVNQKQHHQPDLNRQESRPGKALNDVRREIIYPTATQQEMDQRLTDAEDERARPVDRSFEKDGLNHWCSVEAAHK